jgi:hypothetical protein
MMLSIVVLIINCLVFASGNVTNYLYIFDVTYAIGNSAHLVSLSVSNKGLSIKDDPTN